MAKKAFAVNNLILAAILLAAAFFPAGRAQATSSFAFTPATAVVSSGTQFTINLVINAGQAINAAQGTVTFPTSNLQIVQVSKSGSIFQFWSQEPTFSNANGTLEFSGGVPSPGFIGSNGTVLRITFRATGKGAATVNLAQGAAILANDGLGTNVLRNVAQGVYTIGAVVSTPPPEIANEIVSRAYPNSNLWYNNPSADFSWIITADVDRVAYELSQTAGGKPAQGYEATDHAKISLADKADGIWYFNLQLRARGTWGKVLTKKIKVDRTPPSAAKIASTTTDPTEPRPTFSLSVTDVTSGVKSHRIKVGGGDWLETSLHDADPQKITLPLQAPGTHLLTVEVSDFAGNVSVATTDFEVKPIAAPVITDYPRKVSSALHPEDTDPVIVIKGEAPGATAIKVYMQNRGDTVTFSSAVPENGLWSATYSGALSPGTWTVTAQAEDGRGAMSLPTDPVFMKVNDTAGNLIRFFAAWGAVAWVVLLALVVIAFTIIAAWEKLKHYRLKLKKEIMAAQVQLIKDFQQVEKDLDGRTAKARQEVAEDIDRLAKDIGKELERMKKDVD